jgi:hypothetical protein
MKSQLLTDARSVAICLCCMVASCATGPTKDRIVEVDKPVAVQPIRADQIPAIPAPLPKRPANVSSALDLALAQVCAFVGYALKADPLLRVSAGLPPREVPKFPECER